MNDEKLLSLLSEFYGCYRSEYFHKPDKLKEADEAFQRMKQLVLQQEPEIDDMEKYVIDKACEASRFYSVVCKTVEDSRKFITQIISDARGRKASVSKTRLDECVGTDGDYLNLKALMYELGVEITPRTKPVPQPKVDEEYIREKATELERASKYNLDEAIYIITQIIGDAKGKQVEVDKAFIEDKARELYEMGGHVDRTHGFMYAISLDSAKKFILSILKRQE